MNVASLMNSLALITFGVLGKVPPDATRQIPQKGSSQLHTTPKYKALIGGRDLKHGFPYDKNKAYDSRDCKFSDKGNHWCWVASEQVQWVMDFLNSILTEDKPKRLLKYQVRIKLEPPGLKGGWQMLVKYIADKGNILVGLFYFPWLPNDKFTKGYAIEHWSSGEKAKDDRPWPELKSKI